MSQEPALDDGATVMENIQAGVQAVQAELAEFEQLAVEMAEPDCDMDALLARMDVLQAKLISRISTTLVRSFST